MDFAASFFRQLMLGLRRRHFSVFFVVILLSTAFSPLFAPGAAQDPHHQQQQQDTQHQQQQNQQQQQHVDQHQQQQPVVQQHQQQYQQRSGTMIYRRFEYKHSFRVPSLAQRDGTIPFWTLLGDAIGSDEQLRLAPSMRSRKGAAWNKRPMVESEHFEIDVAFKVTGQGRIGADGMGIWYTAAQGGLGPVFGSNDYWTGMAVLLDSFDNDGQRNNPAISLMVNDGTRSFDHQTDGSSQVLAQCQKDFRNKQYPISLKITYIRNILTVLISDGLSPQPRYELCIRAENVFLPRQGFFGVSGATGGLADDHDVLEYSVYSLFTDPVQLERVRQITDEERKKYEAEFELQQKQFEEERKKFKEQHPEKARDDDDLQEMAAKVHEDAAARELRLIYESQAGIYKILQQLELKLQEVAQRQLTQLQQGSAVQAGGGGVQPPQQGGGVPSFAPHEKQELLQAVRDLSAELRTIKQYSSEIFTRTYAMEQKLNTAPGAVQGGGQQDRALLEQMNQELRNVRLAQQQQIGDGGGGLSQHTCLSTTMFVSILALQSLVILMFIFFRL